MTDEQRAAIACYVTAYAAYEQSRSGALGEQLDRAADLELAEADALNLGVSMGALQEARGGRRNYLLFTGDTYYARGGACDLTGRYDTLEAAQQAVAAMDYPPDWWHVFDLATNKIVARSEQEAYAA